MLKTAAAVSPLPSTGTSQKTSRRRRKAPSTSCRRLVPAGHSDDLQPLADTLKSRVLGQNQATDALISSLSRLLSGLRDPARPLLTALFLGPTGVGKTETARALALALFGDERGDGPSQLRGARPQSRDREAPRLATRLCRS